MASEATVPRSAWREAAGTDVSVPPRQTFDLPRHEAPNDGLDVMLRKQRGRAQSAAELVLKRPWSSGIRDVQEKETAGGRQGPPAPAPETAAPRGDGAASVLLRSSPSPSRKILPPSLLPPSSLPPGHATAAPVLSVLPPRLSFLSASIAWLADRAVRSLPSGRLSFTSAPSGLPEPRFPFVLHHIHHRCSPRTSRPLDDQLREVDLPMRKRDSPSA
ncbi:hypothetical protein M432DRAFT_639585 [Thermoascus aurantiacus ATCC 26904]